MILQALLKMMSTDEYGKVQTAARPRGRGIRRFGLVEVPAPGPPLPPEERKRVNDIQQEAKKEVTKAHVPAITVASKKRRGRGSPSPNSSSSSSSSPHALKTPAAFLNEICTKSCSKFVFQFDNVGNPGVSGYFKCTAIVTAKNGNVIEGNINFE